MISDEKRGTAAKKGAADVKRWRRDLLLIALLLAAALTLLLLPRPSAAGAAVLVLQDGEEIGRYPLSEDRTVSIGEEAYNLLTIKNGAAAVTEANCGDHTCVRTGWIDRTGEQIICLPHRLIIKVVGGGSSDWDAVAW